MTRPLAALTLAVALALPASAAASTVANDPATNRTVFKGGSEANAVLSQETAFFPVPQIGFTDAGSPLTAGAGCAAGATVVCDVPGGGLFGSIVEFRPGGGDDRVRASYGSGYPIIYGAAGNDRLQAGGQRGDVYGGDGNDLVIARVNTPGAVEGNAGNDLIVGGENVATLSGGSGEDFIISNGARLGSPLGGAGWDTLIGLGQSNGSFSGGVGNDLIAFGPGVSGIQASGGDGADRIYGSDGPDRIDGGTGSDHIDTFGDGQVDTVSCGSDFDWVYADADDVVSRCEVVVRGRHLPANPSVGAAIAYAQSVATDPFDAVLPG
jgi:Ca2+-binding RTX toxin-like protein